mgnify:CR=1 FL=1
MTKLKVRRLFWALLLGGLAFFVWWCVAMPGQSYRGPLPPAAEETRQLSAALEKHVRYLSEKIGERHHYTYRFQKEGTGELEQAADWIEGELRQSGLAVERQSYSLGNPPEKFCNLVAERKGGPEIVVVGAHYDSIPLRAPTTTPVAWLFCWSWPGAYGLGPGPSVSWHLRTRSPVTFKPKRWAAWSMHSAVRPLLSRLQPC